VHAYYGETAQLLLRNQYPATTPDVPSALVSIGDLLSNGQRHLLEVGAWLNIIGNVRGASILNPPAANLANASSATSALQSTAVVVDATMIWSAGVVKLEKYETAVQQYQRPLNAG